MPYREEKPLSEIIAPDRRREKTIALVVVSMVAGIGIFLGLSWAFEAMKKKDDIGEPQPVDEKRFTPVTLQGPDGSMRVPPSSRAIVHVWLQACADCMPAFEAMREIDGRGGIGAGVPEINVSYGQADPAWAARYGVRRNLVYDRGGASIVRPLGISTFTTLVVDENGVVLHRDRPDRPGYVERLRSIVGTSPQPTPSAEAGDPQAVVRAHMQEVRKKCWEGAIESNAPSKVDVTLTIRLGPDGRVTGTDYQSNDQVVGRCVANVFERVAFPAPGQATTIKVPFHFVRQ